MDKLISFLKKAFSYPALLYATHPITTVSMIAATILFAIYSLISAMTDYSAQGLGMDV